MPKLPPRLCPKHARGEREDDIDGIEVRPPSGNSACPLCKKEAAETEQVALARMTAGTRTFEHNVSVEEPDSTYVPKTERAQWELDRLRDAAKEEAKRVAPAVAKLDAERATLIELDQSKPGPERQRAFDRHMRVLGGGGRRRRERDISFDFSNGDFDAAMESAQALRERIRADLLESNEGVAS